MRWNDLFFFPGIIVELSGVIILVAGIITGQPVLFFLGMGIIGIGVALTIIRFIRLARAGAGTSDPGMRPQAGELSEKPEDSTILYHDHLVSISGDSITFHHYSFPLFLSDRKVYFRDIVRIDVKKTAPGAGKWRIAGSGDFKTWFPLDGERPSRDKTFYAMLKAGWWNIGFTVEDSSRVTSILREKGIISPEPDD
jgi:hypothetical protein